jgi:hypothetical protein
MSGTALTRDDSRMLSGLPVVAFLAFTRSPVERVYFRLVTQARNYTVPMDGALFD